MTAAGDAGTAAEASGVMTQTEPRIEPAEFLPIDPFGAAGAAASRIAGLGGTDAPADPGYVFRSGDVFPSPGAARFELHLHGVDARSGTLTLKVEARSLHPGTNPVPVATATVPMEEVAAADGRTTIPFVARRNMVYIASGRIDDDTDARALAASLSLHPRPGEVTSPETGVVPVPPAPPCSGKGPARLGRPELVTANPPVLSAPVSQPMTAAQLRDPLLAAWIDALGEEAGDPAGRADIWSDAAVLQALHHYTGGAALNDGHILGITARSRSLPAYLAGRGVSVLIAAPDTCDLPEGDPGLMLEQMARPALCSPDRFFASVHATALTQLSLPPDLTGFDALWSADDTVTREGRARFAATARSAMACLRPGRLAIHVLRYSGELAPTIDLHSPSYSRVEIERLALSLIADGHDVAPLSFAIDADAGAGNGEDLRLPFVLIARRHG